VRQRYFTINWLQMATTWAAFALFLLALIALQAALSQQISRLERQLEERRTRQTL
jgi:hypothetical protein